MMWFLRNVFGTPTALAAILIFTKQYNHFVLVYALAAVLLNYYVTKYIISSHSNKIIDDAMNAIDGYSENYSLRKYDILNYLKKHNIDIPNEKFKNLDVIVASPSRSDVRPIDTYKSYMSMDGPLIIIGENPDDMGWGQVYTLMHELGHSVISGAVHNIRIHRRVISVLSLYLPLLFLTVGMANYIAIVFALALHYWLSAYIDRPEIAADQFAAQNLSKIYGEERATLYIDQYIERLKNKLSDEKSGKKRKEIIKELSSRIKGFSDHFSNKKGGFIKYNNKYNKDSLTERFDQLIRLGPLTIATLTVSGSPSIPESNFIFLLLLWAAHFYVQDYCNWKKFRIKIDRKRDQISKIVK